VALLPEGVEHERSYQEKMDAANDEAELEAAAAEVEETAAAPTLAELADESDNHDEG